ncbi:MAG: hypothetical protein IPK97_15590 [Ahniella sp.]|nr:hypothetical protein [Ahniella sp.]
MRILLGLSLLLLADRGHAQPSVIDQIFGRADIETMTLAESGEFHAMTRLKDGRQVLEARRVEGNVMHFSTQPESGRIVDFRLLPQRRLAWVVRVGDGAKARDTLSLVHLSTRKQRTVFSADRIRFPHLVPADMYGFELLVDSLGRRPKTELRRVEFEQGKGELVSRLSGTCELINDAAGALRFADCMDTREGAGHVHLQRRDDGGKWIPMSLEGLDATQRLVGTFADGSLLLLELPAAGGSRVWRLKNGERQELSASQSRQPTVWMRSFDGRSIIGALWLTGDPNAEIFDPGHPDASRYLQWTIQHPGTIIDVRGRSFDQRLTLVALTSANQSPRFELWHRDQQIPSVLGRVIAESFAPEGLKREPRQLALRDERLRDVFVTGGLLPRKHLAVVLASDPPVWGYVPFVAALADQGFDVVELDAPAGSVRERAEHLLDALKWARNMQMGGDRPACLFADPEVLAAVKPMLYALSTECLIGLPAGRIPTLALQAAPLLEQAAKLDATEARL